MSTIKSSAENLTLNADGANNDIKFQSNGSEVASIDQAGSLVLSGNLTSLGIDDNATSTAITIDASEDVLIAGDLTLEDGGVKSLKIKGTQSFLYLKENDITDLDSRWMQSGGNLYLSTVTSSDALVSTSLKVTNSNNDVTVSAGNLVIGTSGKGIDFSANGNAGGMSSEVLDDYEEGTWTAGCSVGTVSEPNGASRYTKIGRLVTLSFGVGAFSNDSSSTYIRITGLPFARTGTVEAAGACHGERFDVTHMVAYNMADGIQFRNGFGSSTYVYVSHANITNGSDSNINCTFTYETA